MGGMLQEMRKRAGKGREAMLLSGGILVSKCCHAVVYDDDGYHCSKCLLLCEPDGTLRDLYQDKNEQQRLESTLARTFVKMQRERVPNERQKLWTELLRLTAEIERLSDG